jgi:hypothetical protein
MQTLVVDTQGIVKKLEQRGFSRAQAEGITEALQELDTSNLVTKADLREALRALELRLYKFMFAAMSAQTALIVALLEYFK